MSLQSNRVTLPLRSIRPHRRGFTLVELLVVIGLIAILATFVAPAVSTILKGSQLTQAGASIEQTLTRARQLALAQNRKTEVRFYIYDDPEVPGTDKTVRALQIFQVEDSGTGKPVGKIQKFPPGATVNESSVLSPLMSDLARKKSFSSLDPKVDLPQVKQDYTAVFMRFLPDGSTDLSPTGGDAGRWFVTVHDLRQEPTSTTPPANYYTVQIDPVLGTLRTHRP